MTGQIQQDLVAFKELGYIQDSPGGPVVKTLRCQCRGHWELGLQGFPDGTNGKESACSVGGLGLILGSGRSPGEGDGYPPQYSCLENSMDRGAWWATVHRVAKNWTRLSE